MQPFQEKRDKLSTLKGTNYFKLLDEIRQDDKWYKKLRDVVAGNLSDSHSDSKLDRICTVPAEHLSPLKHILDPAVLSSVVPYEYGGRPVDVEIAGWAVFEATGLAIAGRVYGIPGVWGTDQDFLPDGRRCWTVMVFQGTKLDLEQLPEVLREADWFIIPKGESTPETCIMGGNVGAQADSNQTTNDQNTFPKKNPDDTGAERTLVIRSGKKYLPIRTKSSPK
ncbi:hypothetical protein ASPACDRAFT_62027 [Aspergillus aculeatus ATCC 16872]|uniref:Uncharacterized protein n=1 Tax=Aspergillus aculeatus (strain ATCC 16872 / CBS 172.66 / WB 5094) TaxID=690307 RepID=A0A1L9WQS2_ASPA1|nr:uncharacterized protein ASPACDRAFT_62027 [Aspergillus aculeatus ATCC 16872]OJJ98525.1 hypothetical protein ASPACDRAFT_62027 [Aspergillus aculeatus ATCC 16872]